MNGEIWRFEWKDDLNIGAPEIDRDHQEAINLIAELIEATLEMQQLEIVLQKMQMVLDHTRRHFASEEAYLRQWRYGDIRRHMLEHESIVSRFAELMDSITNNTSVDDWTGAALSVRNTLIDHFLHEDLKFRNLHLVVRVLSSAAP